MDEKVIQLIDEIKELTVLQVSELVKALEEEFGVSATPVAVAGPAAAAGDAGAGADEQTEFDVILAEVGDSKMAVIKEVRAITGLGLKESKELVDNAPSPIKEGADKDQAEEIKKQLEETGAKVELK